MNEQQEKKYYNCFSLTQLKYIKSNGIKPINVMIHSKTKRTFWIFKIDDALSEVLTNWTLLKKNKEKTAV